MLVIVAVLYYPDCLKSAHFNLVTLTYQSQADKLNLTGMKTWSRTNAFDLSMNVSSLDLSK